jgi:probable HAF family extracellular repeat protein
MEEIFREPIFLRPVCRRMVIYVSAGSGPPRLNYDPFDRSPGGTPMSRRTRASSQRRSLLSRSTAATRSNRAQAQSRRTRLACEPLEPRQMLTASYALVDLGTLPGFDSETAALGINDAGAVVGYSASETVRHGFSWQAGVITDMGDLGGGYDQSLASAINSSGQVAGQSYSGLGDRAVLWQNGVLTDLDNSQEVGRSSFAYGINDAGQIVGIHDEGAGNRAFLWESGEMSTLAGLPTNNSRAWSINNA